MGADLLIRSHQLPSGGRGATLHHDHKVITVFSASNYAGMCDNMGAVLVLPASGQLRIETHQAILYHPLPRRPLCLALWCTSAVD